MALPIIPEYITVHLGAPNDTSAPNVRVPFIDYIKNVASSEIYPTWPENALRANIYAQISYALNRIYTEYYRSRGYDFDITSTTQFDQKFIPDRAYFDTISTVVDDIFNDYIVREGNVVPLFAQYCNGTTVMCDGLSQWGTVALANQGLSPYEILQYYFGNAIGIVFDAPTGETLPSYPGTAQRLGAAGEEVRILQRQLNRIGLNYPAIGPALPVNGIFDQRTQTAVTNFQRIFNLTQDGIVGKATWYKIKSIYNGVKGLAELEGEGLSYSEVDRVLPDALRPGDTGIPIRILQFYLAVIGYYNNNLPVIAVTGTFDQATENAVRALQTNQGITVDGVVGRETWNEILKLYDQTRASLGQSMQANEIYPGRVLSLGESGAEITRLQQFINLAAQVNPAIPQVPVTGTFDIDTQNAVYTVQDAYGLDVTGSVGALTWGLLVYLAKQAE